VIQPELAREAVQKHIADPLGTGVDRAAMGIFKVLAHSMTEAISLHSVRKGYDPREFSLVAEGGAGPLFAWHIAEQLGIPRVIVPRHPGIASAMGLLTTDIRYEIPTTVWTSSAAPNIPLIAEQMKRLEEEARAQLRADGVGDEDITLERSADCRYMGQGYELRVHAPDGQIDEDWVAATAAAFHDVHGRTYSQRFEDKPVHLVNIRVTGVGAVPHVVIGQIEASGEDPAEAIKTTARALFWRDEVSEPEWVETPVYERSRLKAGNRISGPAIIEQFDSTTVIGMNQQATVDAVGHLILERTNA
jgi:N-methylhydantoinase A/oxoprolinase/acetone carboxylase beta subunit